MAGELFPPELEHYLKGVDFPAHKRDLLHYIKTGGAPDNLLYWLGQVPERDYADAEELARTLAHEDRAAGLRAGGDARREAANPAEVANYLKGIAYPADKRLMLDQAKSNTAPDYVLSWISQLPERQYQDANEIVQAVSGR